MSADHKDLATGDGGKKEAQDKEQKNFGTAEKAELPSEEGISKQLQKVHLSTTIPQSDVEAELKAVQEQRRTEQLLFKLKNMTPSNYGKEAGVEDQQEPPIVAMPSSRKRRFVQKTPDEEETKAFKVLLERLKNMTPSRLPPSEDREPGMDHEHENERSPQKYPPYNEI